MSWSDFMEEIRPSHKAFWKITKALKTEDTPTPSKDRTVPLPSTTPEVVVHSNSIETQCSHASPPHDLLISVASRKSNHLFGKGLIIDEQFGFRSAHSCPQQVLRLIEYATEGFKRKNKTVAVFFDVAKAFDRVNRHLGHTASSLPHKRVDKDTKLDKRGKRDKNSAVSARYALKLNPCGGKGDTVATRRPHGERGEHPRLYKQGHPKGASSSSAAADGEATRRGSSPLQGVKLSSTTTTTFHSEPYQVEEQSSFTARLGALLGRKSKLSKRNKRTIYKMCIRTVMTYASPVFAHAAPKTLERLQIILNKFCRAATDAHWCVRNSILHRDLELPTLSKYMKDASKRFFDIAGSHPNALLRAAVDYQPPPPPTLSCRAPRVYECVVPRSVSRAAAVKPRASVPARSSGYPAVCTPSPHTVSAPRYRLFVSNSTLRLCWIRSHVVSSGGPRARQRTIGSATAVPAYSGVSLQPLQLTRGFLSVVAIFSVFSNSGWSVSGRLSAARGAPPPPAAILGALSGARPPCSGRVGAVVC
ncbi:Probable RNA-directed DNA polymerase from transposon BS [Eumeta japonica]|uniref:Probable RNA-directed DNA polymerase from transposon BS n=1 Tax=Eumeta variegata TaxID=151549 RepID=A0A4C1XUI0_EUMVA|nr:Probable RNA-directed DNA polymerase from transposon BS [Eumeta japonica]